LTSQLATGTPQEENSSVLPIVVGLAQHGDGVALGLAIQLGEHRANPLKSFEQPRGRRRGSAVKEQLERRGVRTGQCRMIEQQVNHRRYEQRDVDPLARDGGEHGIGIESAEQMHAAP